MTALVDYERAALGALVEQPRLAATVPWLTPTMFANDRERHVMSAVLSAADKPSPDAMTVLEAMRAAGLLTAGAGPFLHELIAACPSRANLPHYAKQIANAWKRQQVAVLGGRLVQAAESMGDLDELALFTAEMADLASSILAPLEGADRLPDGLYEMGEFVGEEEPEPDWIIPGLLERMDRVMVVATEGAGKTMLARSIVTAVASGRHPFDPSVAIPPQRALLVDLENPDALTRRKIGPMVGYMRNAGAWQDGAAWVWMRPGGIDLRRPTDQRLFERVIEHTRPHLVCLGPMYKASAQVSGERDEQAAREVAGVLDRMRERYRLTFWLEHHAPLEQNGEQRKLRPIGTSLWQRWPEFGIALRKVKESEPEFKDNPGAVHVDHWRGQRDEREWPQQLHRSTTGWPWIGYYQHGRPEWMRKQR